MYQCPITYYTDNLIFNIDKSIWAAYKFVGYEYDFLADDVKISLLYKMAKFLSNIMSEAQILIVPIEQDSKEHFRKLRDKLDKNDSIYEQVLYHVDNTEIYLNSRKATQGEINDYRSYILVKLADYTDSEFVTGFKSAYEYFIKDPVNAINVFLNVDRKDILMSKLNSAIKAAERWHFKQHQKIRLVELESKETQWLFRRMAFRGLNKSVKLFKHGSPEDGMNRWKPRSDVEKVGKERVVKPYERDVINLFSGSIHVENRMIRVEHDRNTVSYQTFLALTNLPDSYEYPGMEWIYMLQQYNMQAEVCIHIKSIEYRSAQKKLDNKKKEIDQQMKHVEEAGGDVPEDLDLGMEYANEMESELKNLKEPLLNIDVTICVASDDPEDLERKVDTIRNAYEDDNFVLERPLADQVNLFMQCIPTVGCIVKDYVMPMTPLTLASAVIGATHELGDREGPFIGTTGAEDKPVFLSLGLACLLNKSASATFYGNLGVGKSFNANLLLVLVVLYGGYGLIFDPKSERSHWEKDFGILKGLITTVNLSAERKNKGKLDPYNIYRDDISEADELAINILSELLKIEPTSVDYTAILEAQRIMRDEELPSMHKLIEILGNFPKSDELYERARFLARRFRLQAETGMSQLLFGYGTEDAISFDNRLNILQISNLKLPAPETKKENYTSEELLSTVIMAVISNFAKRFAMVERPVFKCILFDESWMLGKTTVGVNMYDFLSRMGRSLYTGCIFNGHSVLDLPSEGIKNTISYKFCFQTSNDAEAARMCAYMGMEATQSNMEILKSLGNAECLFQDLDGHIGILKFDAVFQDLIDIFSTTPKTEKKVELPSAKDDPDEIVESPEVQEDARELQEATQETVLEQSEEPVAATSPPAFNLELDVDYAMDEEEDFEDWEFTEEELYRKEDI